MEIIFDMARRLDLGDRFWGGNIEETFYYQIAPLGITVEDLRKHPEGITFGYQVGEKAYSRTEGEAKSLTGFNTATRRVEIYSQLFKDYGYEPLPSYRESKATATMSSDGLKEYPLSPTGYKLMEYVHGSG